jgi:hypothetical protein
MYSIVALHIHNPQLRKVGKYQRGKLGTVTVCLFFIFCAVVYRPLFIFLFGCLSLYCYVTGRRGHDRMVVGFTTTYAISAYLHWCRGTRVLKFEQQTHTKSRGWTRVLKIEQQTHTKPRGWTRVLKIEQQTHTNPRARCFVWVCCSILGTLIHLRGFVLLNLKYPGSPTGLCVGQLLNLLKFEQHKTPWGNQGT